MLVSGFEDSSGGYLGVGRWQRQGEGSQNPETSMNARFGDGGGGGGQMAGGTPKTSSCARFQGWENCGGGRDRRQHVRMSARRCQ